MPFFPVDFASPPGAAGCFGQGALVTNDTAEQARAGVWGPACFGLIGTEQALVQGCSGSCRAEARKARAWL